MPFTIGGEWVPSDKNEGKTKKITLRLEKRKGRVLTLIQNVEEESSKKLLKQLKKECHCGGTIQNETLELQGDHLEKVKKLLKKEHWL